jgi:hypothetical protein
MPTMDDLANGPVSEYEDGV